MNKQNLDYQAPEVEVLEISVEKGFANSTPSQNEDYVPEKW